ncbi:MAG: isopenicillin N synthase family dioxygenase [Betaproteobacteria bacterium]
MNRHSARKIAVDEIPVIEVDALLSPDRARLKAIGEQMREAAERIGFFYVSGHGIAQELIDEVDATARRFFASSLDKKLAIEPVGRHRGYIKQGEAKMYDRARPDLKESFIWGLDIADNDPDFLAGNRMIGPNRWPDWMPEMRPLLNRYLDEAHACARRLLGALAVSLDAPQDAFTRQFSKPISRGSLVYYPPQAPELGDRQYGVAPHTDYGVITLLHQDPVGGLQVATRGGEWVTATPIPGTLVINSGDLMGRWSNDVFRSNPHRVINSSGRERLSIAVFVDPDYDTPIVPVTEPGVAPRYPEVTCGEYILGRFDKAFEYRKRAG